MIALLSHSRNGQGRSAWQVSVSVTRHLGLPVAVVYYGFRLQLPPPPFTPARSSSAARLREGAARSPFVLRSGQPRLRVAARDRSDTAARRRVRLPWQAFDGARQGICAGQRVVRRPWALRLSRNPGNIPQPVDRVPAFDAPRHLSGNEARWLRLPRQARI